MQKDGTDRGAFHSFKKAYEIFSQQKDFYGFLVDFSCKQKDFCQRRTKFFGVKCPSAQMKRETGKSSRAQAITILQSCRQYHFERIHQIFIKKRFQQVNCYYELFPVSGAWVSGHFLTSVFGSLLSVICAGHFHFQ